MRIAVFSTFAGRGGAPAAMRRLVRGLRARGHEVDIFSLAQTPEDPDVVAVTRLPLSPQAVDLVGALQDIAEEEVAGPNRTDLSNTFFSLPLAGYRLVDLSSLQGYDAINIHWVAQFLSIGALLELAALRRPLLFTLHDMQPFTGGCHYSAGCRKFETDCVRCPQLTEDLLGLPAVMLSAKRGLARFDNVAAVAPSRWMRDCAAGSGVFAPARCHHVDNAVESGVFRPIEKAAARAALGIAPDVRTILFGADNNLEKRKGFDHLIGMLAALKTMSGCRHAPSSESVTVLNFGLGSLDLDASGFPVHQLGQIREDQRMALAYSAADLLVLPSLEDNQPNVMLESMACGTPVVSFAVGGMRETIEDGRTGRLIAPFDVPALAQAVGDLLADPEARRRMGMAAREAMVRNHAPERQAERYESLLLDLGASSPGAAAAGRSAADAPPVPGPRSIRPSVRLGIDATVVKGDLLAALEHRIQSYYQRKVVAALEARHRAELERNARDMAALRAVVRERDKAIAELRQELHAQGIAIHRFEVEARGLDEVSRLSEEVLRTALASTSWRLLRPLRRLLGAAEPAVASQQKGQRALEALGNLLAVYGSTSWELAAPLRLLRRAWQAAATRAGRRRDPPSS